MLDYKKIIKTHLRLLGIKYSITEYPSNDWLYELTVLSTKAYIEVEYDLNNTIIVFYAMNYRQEWDNKCGDCDTIECEIDNLIEYVKRYKQASAKIAEKIKQIEGICKMYDLHINNFITINY